MIILDTNVVSEALNSPPDARVIELARPAGAGNSLSHRDKLSGTATGVEYLPDGKRKKGLADNMSILIARLFEDRVLAFDKERGALFMRRWWRARRLAAEP